MPATGCRSTPRAPTSTTSPTRRRSRRRCSSRISMPPAPSAAWPSAIAKPRRPTRSTPIPATCRSIRGITSKARPLARAAAPWSITCSRRTANTCLRVALNSGDGSRFEDVDISVDGQRVALLAYETLPAGGADGRGAVDIKTEPILVKAGQHEVAAAFVKRLEGPYEDLVRPHDWSYAGGGSGGGGITNLPHLRDLIITGPTKTTGVSETPARQKIFTCRPTSGDEELRCARSILTNLASEAYRRPATLREIDRLMPFFEQGAENDGFEGGVRTALEAILASPYFIFRLEREPSAASRARPYGSRISISPRASRSSSGARRRIRICSPPRSRASSRRRSGSSGRSSRMLADPRSDALGTRFAAQWLRLQDVDKVHPDPNFYPNFDDNLAAAMRQETDPVLQHAGARRSQRPRPLSRRLHGDQRAAGAPLRHSRRLRPAVPQGAVSRRHAARRARTGQHPGADLARQSHVAGAARQVGDGSAARHAAATAAARHSGARGNGGGERRQDAHHARAHGDAPRQPDVQRVSPLHGSDRPRAR